MRILFAVLCLFVVCAVSYPSLRQMDASDDEENKDLQLELRSILKHLSHYNEQMERSFASEEEDNSNEDDDSMSKRQGGYNTVSPNMKCEIECVGRLRNPDSGKGMSIKEATKACKDVCANRK